MTTLTQLQLEALITGCTAAGVIFGWFLRRSDE